MCVWVFCPNGFLYTTYMPPALGRQKEGVWSYGTGQTDYLWATNWVLGIKPWSNGKAANALNLYAIFPVSRYHILINYSILLFIQIKIPPFYIRVFRLLEKFMCRTNALPSHSIELAALSFPQEILSDFFICFCFSRQGFFCVPLGVLELIEIHRSLPPECWS